MLSMKIKKVVGGLLATSTFVVGGCGETTPEVPKANIAVDEIIASAHPTLIAEGESAFVRVVSPHDTIGRTLIKKISLVDHIYPNGPTDDMAPAIGTNPFRSAEQVSLSGDNAKLHNDGACDSYPIEGEPRHIGAVAIGGDAKGLTISWPEGGDYAQICAYQDMEPKTEHGVVLFATDRSF